MTLGDKIKKARLDRHMTQREVVGDYITRNMLSKIENNSATPSMKTLEFLASQLGLPAGYFVSEDVTEIVPRDLQRARKAYADGDALEALTLLDDMDQPPTDESWLLSAKCHLQIAELAGRGNDAERALHHARAALTDNEKTTYRSDTLEAAAMLLIARFDPAAFEDSMERYRAAKTRTGLDRLYHLTMAQHHLSEGETEQAAAELEQLNAPDDAQASDYLRLQGELSLRGQAFGEAAKQLRRAEQLAVISGGSEEALGPLYALLEECYREMEDYKTAYHYASKQIQR